jgi:hypothetical protein
MPEHHDNRPVDHSEQAAEYLARIYGHEPNLTEQATQYFGHGDNTTTIASQQHPAPTSWHDPTGLRYHDTAATSSQARVPNTPPNPIVAAPYNVTSERYSDARYDTAGEDETVEPVMRDLFSAMEHVFCNRIAQNHPYRQSQLRAVATARQKWREVCNLINGKSFKI